MVQHPHVDHDSMEMLGTHRGCVVAGTWIIQDTTPPVFDALPTNLTEELTTPTPTDTAAYAAWLAAAGETTRASDTLAAAVVLGASAVGSFTPAPVPEGGTIHCLAVLRTVVFTATDACGNTANATAHHHLRDTTPPAVTVPAADHVIESDGHGNSDALLTWLNTHGGAVATDSLPGDLHWSYAPDPPVFVASETVQVSHGWQSVFFSFAWAMYVQ